MHKGMSPIIAMVFVILISVTALGVVFSIGLPLIDRLSESAVVGEAEANMDIFDDYILESASEGFGITKKTTIEVSGGTYRVDTNLNTTTFNLTLESNLIPANIVTDGNIIKTVENTGSGDELQMKLQYSNIKIEGDMRIGEGSHDVCFKKTGLDGKKIIINVTDC